MTSINEKVRLAVDWNKQVRTIRSTFYKGQNIGQALSLVSKFWQGVNQDEEYGEAMGAPMGELRRRISGIRARQLRFIRRRVKALTGLKWSEFENEVEKRTSARWVHFYSGLGECHSFEREH